MRVVVLCSRVRVEEKMLFAALREREIEYDRIDPREVVLELGGDGLEKYDAALVRCLSHSQAYYITRWLESAGIPSVSPHNVVAACGDKLITSIALQDAGVPIPRTVIAFTEAAALEAIAAGVKLLVIIPDRVPIWDVLAIS